MTSKVFLFDDMQWLYCIDVTFKDGIWQGYVVNGNWFMHFDTNNTIRAYRDRQEKNLGYIPVTENEARLTWLCDPGKGKSYNHIIEDAKNRYYSGEVADYTIKQKHPKKKVQIEDEEVPF